MPPKKKSTKKTKKGAKRASAAKKKPSKKKTSRKAKKVTKTRAGGKSKRTGVKKAKKSAKKSAKTKKTTKKKTAPKKKTAAKKKTPKKSAAKKGTKKPARTRASREKAASQHSRGEAPSTSKERHGEVATLDLEKRELAPASKPARKRKLTTRQLQKIRSLLQEKQKEISRHMQTELSELENPDKGGGSDIEDLASDADGTDSLCEIMDIEAAQIGQIETALKKIEDGTYGVCEDCSQEIDPARLEALPFASQCIECKRKDELSGNFSSFSYR
jgi:RNA polymerase-binding protein DksA